MQIILAAGLLIAATGTAPALSAGNATGSALYRSITREDSGSSAPESLLIARRHKKHSSDDQNGSAKSSGNSSEDSASKPVETQTEKTGAAKESAAKESAEKEAAAPLSDAEKATGAKPSAKHSFSGNASWYGIPFHGRKTASGEIFNMYKLSAAHLTLPLPTKALVEDPRTGNAIIVKVNDRGPYVKTRVMDLSREAARQLGTLPRGVAFVDITVLELPHRNRKTQ